MCITPTMLPNGIEVACRLCWQCRERKINDWVGRCIAESKTSVATHSVTLTYGRDDHNSADHLHAQVLTYSDVQKYLKYLRVDGFPLRYFAVGEYGSEKGRTHWHLILFWQRSVPELVLNKRYNQKHWPHGWSYFEKMSAPSVRYVCKYIGKDMTKMEQQSHMSLSKKPPLGNQFFENLAVKYVQQGLAPQDLHYTFPDVIGKDGKKTSFVMFGKTADNFLRSFVEKWAIRYPTRHIPSSELVEAWQDGQLPEDIEIRLEKKGRHLWKPKGSNLKWFMKPERIKFDEKLNSWYYEFEFGQTPWYWGFGKNGDPEWQSVPGKMNE